jgi:hypothetical protein
MLDLSQALTLPFAHLHIQLRVSIKDRQHVTTEPKLYPLPSHTLQSYALDLLFSFRDTLPHSSLCLIGFSDPKSQESVTAAGVRILNAGMLAPDVEPLTKQRKSQAKRFFRLC